MKATVSDRQNIGINGPYPYYALMSDFDEMLRNALLGHAPCLLFVFDLCGQMACSSVCFGSMPLLSSVAQVVSQLSPIT